VCFVRFSLIPEQVSLQEDTYWEVLFCQFARKDDNTWNWDTIKRVHRLAFSNPLSDTQINEICLKAFGIQLTSFRREQVSKSEATPPFSPV